MLSVRTPTAVGQATPDLTVSKSNSVGGSTTPGSSWSWTLHVTNVGTGPAAFGAGATILVDSLPNTGITYTGGVTIGNLSGIVGDFSCDENALQVTCRVKNSMTINAGGS